MRKGLTVVLAGVSAVVLIAAGAGGWAAYRAHEERQGLLAVEEGSARAWQTRRAALRAGCAQIAADADARALRFLGLDVGDETLRRERIEVFMDARGEPAVVGRISAGPGQWPARYVLVENRMVAAYDRYPQPEVIDAWTRAGAGNESICVLYN